MFSEIGLYLYCELFINLKLWSNSFSNRRCDKIEAFVTVS